MNLLEQMFYNNPTPDAYRVSALVNRYISHIEGFLIKEYDLLFHEWVCIFCIGLAGEMSAANISEVTGRPKNTISRAIHKLLRRKLIERTRDSTDRRLWILTLTPAGQQFYEGVIPYLQKVEKSIFGSLTQEEGTEFDRLLSKLIRHVYLS